MMKTPFLIATACLVTGFIMPGVQAQERSAVGKLDIEMSWSSLANQIAGFDAQLQGLNSRLDQMVLCGKLGKVYAPGAAGADASGCIEVTSTDGTSVTTVINKLNVIQNTKTTATTAYTTNNTNINKIMNCNKSGYVFNGSSCILPVGSAAANCSLVVVQGSSAGHNSGSTGIERGTCPSGYEDTGDTGGSTLSAPRRCSKIVCS